MIQKICSTVLFALSLLSQQLQSEPLVISNIGGNLQERVSTLHPIADYLVKQLQDPRYDQAEVLFSPTHTQLIAAINNGKVHWVTESVYVASILMHEANMQPLLKRNKLGQSAYRSLLVADKSITSPDQLLGKKVAMEAEGSFSGFFLVYRFLVEQGLPVKVLRSPREAPVSDRVNLLFSGRIENSIHWLEQGLVSAAVLNDHEYNNPAYMDAALQLQTHMLYQSPSYPPAIELFSSNLPAQTLSTVSNTLTGMGKTPHSQKILSAYEQSSQFEPLSPQDLENIRSIYSFIQQQQQKGVSTKTLIIGP